MIVTKEIKSLYGFLCMRGLTLWWIIIPIHYFISPQKNVTFFMFSVFMIQNSVLAEVKSYLKDNRNVISKVCYYRILRWACNESFTLLTERERESIEFQTSQTREFKCFLFYFFFTLELNIFLKITYVNKYIYHIHFACS